MTNKNGKSNGNNHCKGKQRGGKSYISTHHDEWGTCSPSAYSEVIPSVPSHVSTN